MTEKNNNVFSKKKTFLNFKKKEIIPSNPTFESRPKSFKLGQHIQPKKDLSRFVKLPKFIRIQRQRKILSKKLKIPAIFKLFEVSKSEKMGIHGMNRLFSKEIMSGALSKFCIHGINKVTNFIRKKKVSMVLIAKDVNPIELIIWMPLLCKKFNTRYLIVESKSRLGKFVNRKKTSCVAIVKH